MRFGILGATEAWDDAGRQAALGGPGRRAVLALLALEAGHIVTVQRLIDGLYGEDPPVGVGNALQSQISRLRRALAGPHNDGSGELIENHPAGYRLAVDPDRVDAHRFARLADTGRAALADGDPAKAAELLRDALALWRGAALADVGEAPFAAPQAVRLEEQRLAATEDRIRAELALGEHRAVIPELRGLVAAHPLRERLSTLLVRALHGSDQQAEALGAYAQAREALADALGADPGPELAAAHLAVLRGAAEPAVSRETSAVRVTRTAVERLAVPVPLNGLVGRGPELRQIEQLLDSARLVTVTGPGGAGKTRIAVETAAGAGQDSCFADLSGLTEGGDLYQAVLSALGVRASGLKGSAEGPSTRERLTAALVDRTLLLVLDNCEHLVADAARLAADLLGSCPGLRILATSREALGITGEQLLPLPPLPEDAAVRLFAERAGAVRPGFDPRQDATAVAEICRRLDGLPLAIELAAARLRLLSPRQIADRLDDRFRLLTGGSRTARPRQQTLRAVVDWSWELLPEAERDVLRRASVFAGGWTLEAAEAVCGAGRDTLELIGALVDKSLVVAQEEDERGEDERSEVRYRLLQTVRAYAAERLAESGAEEEARAAHLAHFLELATTADPYLRTAEQVRWLRRLSAEHDNFSAALTGAPARTACRLIGALAGYWLLRGLRFEGGGYARRVLDELGPHPLPGLEEEYAACVILAVQLPDGRRELADHLAVAGELMAERRRTPGRIPALLLLWAPYTGVPKEAVADLPPEDAALWQADPWHSGLMHIGEGFRYLYVDAAPEAAEREFTAALAGFREIGDRWGMIMALGELATLDYWRDDTERAEQRSTESLRLAAELGATEDLADLLCNRAERRLRSGQLDGALADCAEAVRLYRTVGAAESGIRPRLYRAAVARLRGDPATARALCEPLLAAAPPGWFGGDWLRVSVLLELTRIAVAEGDPATARGHVREALPPGLEARNLPVLADAAEAVAELAVLEGRAEKAAELVGVARELRLGGTLRGVALLTEEAQRGLNGM